MSDSLQSYHEHPSPAERAKTILEAVDHQFDRLRPPLDSNDDSWHIDAYVATDRLQPGIAPRLIPASKINRQLPNLRGSTLRHVLFGADDRGSFMAVSPREIEVIDDAPIDVFDTDDMIDLQSGPEGSQVYNRTLARFETPSVKNQHDLAVLERMSDLVARSLFRVK